MAVVRAVAGVVLLWIAWRILTSGPLSEADERPLPGFLGGAGFQWINPKAWAITGSAAMAVLLVAATLPVLFG